MKLKGKEKNLGTVYVLRDVRVDISALQTVVYPWLVRDLLSLRSRVSCWVERSTNTTDINKINQKKKKWNEMKSLVENTWEFCNYFNLSFARLFFLILLYLGKSYPMSSKSTFYGTKLLFKCVIFSRRGLRFAVKTWQKIQSKPFKFLWVLGFLEFAE